MRYSVYDWTRRVYDYYDAPGPGGSHAGSPGASSVSDLGSDPDHASWKLPMGARHVGSGALAQGRIASLNGSDEVSASPARVLLYAAAIYAVWRILQ